MAEKSSSTIIVAPPPRLTILNGTNPPHNLIILNVNAQSLLKFKTTNYSTWDLQFTSLLFGYDQLGFVDGSKPCSLAMITLPGAVSPSPNPDHTLWLQQGQFLLNVIIRSVSATLVQFISTSTISQVVWTTLKKTYASPSRGQIVIHRQNLVSPQQGNQTITTYIQYVKHNIDSLALMNVLVDFDELSIRVLNKLGPAYSNISHGL